MDASAKSKKTSKKKEEVVIPTYIKENQHIYDSHFDKLYAISLADFVIRPIQKYYFRAELIGFDEDHLPERNNPDHPLIYAGNHSGMAFPWDAIIFSAALFRKYKFDISKSVRPLASPMLSKTKLMNPFLIDDFWKKAGSIDATMLNFETMMHYPDSNLLIYPEGIDGIGKGFNNKYHLQRLSTSALLMSIKYKTDIIPVATINGEYINPFSYSVHWVNDLVRKLGVPFLPIGVLTLLVLVQPWTFYFALPAKLTFVRGKRIRAYEMVDKPVDEISREELLILRDHIQEEMQERLDEAVELYGYDPYDWRDFFSTVFNNFSKILYFIPPTWPFLFVEHERRFEELKNYYAEKLAEGFGEEETSEGEDILSLAKTAIHTVVENPEVLLYYIPIVGWIPAIIKSIED